MKKRTSLIMLAVGGKEALAARAAVKHLKRPRRALMRAVCADPTVARALQRALR